MNRISDSTFCLNYESRGCSRILFLEKAKYGFYLRQKKIKTAADKRRYTQIEAMKCPVRFILFKICEILAILLLPSN